MKLIDLMKPSPCVLRGSFLVTIILSLFIIASVSEDTFGEEAETSETTPPPGAYTVLADDGRVEFPFDIYRGDIRFQCRVNGRPVYMLLDDGYLWDQLLFWGGLEVDSLGLVYDGEIELGGDSNTLVSKTASGITVTFPGVELTDQTAIVTPGTSSISSMWRGSVGQISAGLLKHFVVDIDFDRMMITLTEPDKFTYEGKGMAVPWEPMGNGPRSIPATVLTADGRTVSLKLLMDLGYNDQLQLVTGLEHNITLPEKKLQASLGLNILREETRGYIGRLARIDIGGFPLDDVVVSYVPEENADMAVSEAMIGLRLLSRFNLVFDFYGHRLYVEPNESFDKPFEYNMSGIELGPLSENRRPIRWVHKDSPAEEAGLRAGDNIVEVNGKPVSDYDIFELFSLFKQEGATVDFLIERDDRQFKASLTLRRII